MFFLTYVSSGMYTNVGLSMYANSKLVDEKSVTKTSLLANVSWNELETST